MFGAPPANVRSSGPSVADSQENRTMKKPERFVPVGGRYLRE
jgi:hypothetical protein